MMLRRRGKKSKSQGPHNSLGVGFCIFRSVMFSTARVQTEPVYECVFVCSDSLLLVSRQLPDKTKALN